MSPILKEIKEAFENRMEFNRKYETEEDICNRHAFKRSDEWMYFYLFPEIYEIWEEAWDFLCEGEDFYRDIPVYPCDVMSEEQVLRIMAEHGLL